MPALNGESNVLLTNDIICKEALRLLKNNMVYARIVSKRYEAEFADVGQTVNVQLAPRVKSTSGRVIGIKPMVKRTVPITIDQQENVGLTYTVKDLTLSLGDFSKKFLRSACVQLANKVDTWVATKMLQGGFYQSGTAGTPINQDSILDAMAEAELVGMPRDGLCSVVLDPRDRAAIAKALEGKFNEEMVSRAIRKGFIGEIDDVATYSSANARTQTVGAYGGTPLVNGASQSGASIITDGWTASTVVLKKGDVITFSSVYSVNPQGYDSTGILMQVVVTSDVTSDGSGNATIPISPALNDGTLTTVDSAGNTVSLEAYQNVSALPADNAPIVIAGTASTRYRVAPIFHRDAFALAIPPLNKPSTATQASTMTDEDTGISIALVGGFDITNHAEIWRLDVIWGGETVQPELIRRIIGASVA